jgi:virginiamycin B lyase
VPGGPTYLATAYGSLWVAVAEDDGGGLVRIDPVTSTVLATVRVGGFPVGIAAGFGSIWQANYDDGTLSRVDPATGKVIATIAVGSGPAQLAVAGGKVWVADQDTTLSAVDPATNRRVRTVQVGPGSKFRPIIAAAGSIWTANSGVGISRVEPASGRIQATIPITGCCDSSFMFFRGLLWALDTPKGLAYRIDPNTDRVVDHLTLGAAANGLAVAGGLLWVTHATGVVSWHALDSGRQLGSTTLSGFVGNPLVTDEKSIWVQTIDLGAVTRLATD